MIDSAESMIQAIKALGIVPLAQTHIPGWSIKEMTDPDFWFINSDELGPWDWKIDAIRTGDIVYGKFLNRRAAFATLEYYRHLMNWRRSLPFYRIALGENYDARTIDDRLMQTCAPVVLDAVREYGAVGTDDIRAIVAEKVSEADRIAVGGHVVKYLVPKVRSQAVSFLTSYLEMGTWTVIGDFERVYKGPNLEYKGWQKLLISTPDELYGLDTDLGCTPEESRDFLLAHTPALKY